MRSAVLLLVTVLATTAFSQTDIEGLIQRSIRLQSNGDQIRNIALLGTVNCTKGGSSETGDIALAIDSQGQSSVRVNTQSEHYTILSTLQTDAGSPGVTSSAGSSPAPTSPASETPLALNPTWFSPYFTLVNELQMTTHARTDRGTESEEGRQLRHIEIVNKPARGMSDIIQQKPNQLAGTIKLDEQTDLPESMVFHAQGIRKAGSLQSSWINKHPSFEETVLYSEYQQIEGLSMPMHIQVLLQREPYLDIHITKATVNTGAAGLSSIQPH